MILFIDTSIEEEIRLSLFSDGELLEKSQKNIGYHYSEFLITEIDALLTAANISLKDMRGIVVVVGPGRFSALRTGVSTANTLAWSLNIPAKGINHLEGEDYWGEVKTVLAGCKFETDKFTGAILPQYGKEPNISIKKE